MADNTDRVQFIKDNFPQDMLDQDAQLKEELIDSFMGTGDPQDRRLANLLRNVYITYTDNYDTYFKQDHSTIPAFVTSDGIVAINRGIRNLGQKRFAVCHELAHVALDHLSKDDEILSQLGFTRDDTLGRILNVADDWDLSGKFYKEGDFDFTVAKNLTMNRKQVMGLVQFLDRTELMSYPLVDVVLKLATEEYINLPMLPSLKRSRGGGGGGGGQPPIGPGRKGQDSSNSQSQINGPVIPSRQNDSTNTDQQDGGNQGNDQNQTSPQQETGGNQQNGGNQKSGGNEKNGGDEKSGGNQKSGGDENSQHGDQNEGGDSQDGQDSQNGQDSQDGNDTENGGDKDTNSSQNSDQGGGDKNGNSNKNGKGDEEGESGGKSTDNEEENDGTGEGGGDGEDGPVEGTFGNNVVTSILKNIFSDREAENSWQKNSSTLGHGAGYNQEQSTARGSNDASRLVQDINKFVNSLLKQKDTTVRQRVSNKMDPVYSNTSILRDGRGLEDVPLKKKNLPHVIMYIDASGSWNNTMWERGQRLVSSLETISVPPQDEKRAAAGLMGPNKNLVLEKKYFNTSVFTEKPSYGSGGTSGLCIEEDIIKYKPDNVIIMTDWDIDRKDVGSMGYTSVPGQVWYIFCNTECTELPKHITGQKGTNTYLIKTS